MIFSLSALLRSVIPSGYRPIGYLTRLTQHRCGHRVRSGPFCGMRYTDDAFGSAYIPKLLGIYERELHSILQQIVNEHWDYIIDIGAAEGYYAVGLALRRPDARVIAFEMNTLGQASLAELCCLNGVSQRVTILGQCTPESLAAVLPPNERTLVICDVEGEEGELLDPYRVPGLQNAHILVELHEFAVRGITNRIVARFGASHNIQHVWQQPRHRSEYPFRSFGISLLPQRYLDWAVSEWRPEQMSWLWMKPA